MNRARAWTLAAAIAALGATDWRPPSLPRMGCPQPPPPKPSRGSASPASGLPGRGPAAAGASNHVAVARAVRDARARAGAIARALGVRVGEVEYIDLPQLGQFLQRRTTGIAAAAATVRFAIVGGAAGAGAAHELSANGSAFATVRPADRDRSQPIKLALLAARRQVTPKAAEEARRNARAAARAAGLGLGPIVSISEAPTPYYGYGSTYYDAVLGQFGPGRFCGYYRRPVFRPDPTTGRLRIVRRVPTRRCVYPVSYSVALEVGYLAAERG